MSRTILHMAVVTSVGDAVVYEASHPAQLPEGLQLELDFFLHASLDTLDLLCRERPDCFFPAFESADNARSVSAFCPIGPYRLLLVVEPQSLKRDDVRAFFTQCSRVLADALRNPMATIHAKIQSPAVRDALRTQLERLHRMSVA
jgi:hypothetical protein